MFRTGRVEAAKNKNEKVFVTLWTFIESYFEPEDKIKMLLEEDKKGWNAFHWSIHSKSKATFEIAVNLYEKNFKIEKIKEILEKENENGENLLCFSFDLETFEELWTFMLRLVDGETLWKFLKKSSSYEIDSKNSAEKFEIFKRFIEKNCLKYNVYKNLDFTFVQAIWNFAVETFTKLQIEEILLHENEKGRNVLNFAGENKDESCFKFVMKKARKALNDEKLQKFVAPKNPLWPFWYNRHHLNFSGFLYLCKEIFCENEYKSFLKSTAEDGRTFLHEISLNDAETFQFTFDEFVNIFGLEDMKIFLRKSVDDEGQTMPMFAAKNSEKTVFKTLCKFIKSNFKPEDQKEILLEKDEEGLNDFYSSAQNELKKQIKFALESFDKKK